jgi:hypothetical protein
VPVAGYSRLFQVANRLTNGLELSLGPPQTAHELAVVSEQLDERATGSDASC